MPISPQKANLRKIERFKNPKNILYNVERNFYNTTYCI